MLVTNFKNTPVINPIKEPTAAFNAFAKSLESVMYSPIKAPKKGPKIKPKGPKNRMPTINPIVLPITPDRVPPNFFVPNMGMILSSKKMPKAIKKVRVKNRSFVGTAAVKETSNNPIHPVKGPGITGRKLPKIPIRINTKPTTSKIISILSCKD